VLLETRSDDLRKAIQAAIEDCRQKLVEADEDRAPSEPRG
jgi:hypothetical protein